MVMYFRARSMQLATNKQKKLSADMSHKSTIRRVNCSFQVAINGI